jgi:hypothetical protein
VVEAETITLVDDKAGEVTFRGILRPDLVLRRGHRSAQPSRTLRHRGRATRPSPIVSSDGSASTRAYVVRRAGELCHIQCGERIVSSPTTPSCSSPIPLGHRPGQPPGHGRVTMRGRLGGLDVRPLVLTAPARRGVFLQRDPACNPCPPSIPLACPAACAQPPAPDHAAIWGTASWPRGWDGSVGPSPTTGALALGVLSLAPSWLEPGAVRPVPAGSGNSRIALWGAVADGLVMFGGVSCSRWGS